MEWNVLTQMLSAPNPTSLSTRSLISPAALLVKVIANIFQGFTPCSSIKYAILWVSTLVFPEPARQVSEAGLLYEAPPLSAVHSMYRIYSIFLFPFFLPLFHILMLFLYLIMKRKRRPFLVGLSHHGFQSNL